MPDYRLAARRAAAKYRVDPAIFEAMIQQESGFREGVGSSAGAQDIAQFIPSTAKAYGVTLGDNRVTDDLEGAARYLRDNLRRTGGSYAKALSIYNSGRPDAYKDPNFAKGQTYNYVKNILAAAGKGTGAKGPTGSSPSVPTSQTVTTPGVDNSQARRQALAQFLLGGTTVNPSSGQTSYGGDILQFALAMRGMGDTPGTTTAVQGTPGTSGGISGATGDVAKLVSRANAIDAKKLPYQWGGGHAGRVNPYKAVPLDCSGAVSSVLGIDPRVSGEFRNWGKPGVGSGKGVVIYSNPKHVLMSINGHFFGTSGSNPGGGAGWIPRSQISPEYLKGFTARHE